MEPKWPKIVKAVLRKKNKVGDITLPEFWLYYKTAAIKAVWYWYKNRYMVQQARIESSEINPHTYVQLTYNEGGMIFTRGKRVSSINSARKTGQLLVKEWN